MNHLVITAPEPDTLDWDKVDGMMPAVIQHRVSGEVLMLGYMNRDALAQTCQSGVVTFFSRTRKRLWTKGETSGHHLRASAIHADCDADTLLVLADPQGPTCHLGRFSCFGTDAMPSLAHVGQLQRVVAARARVRPDGSYTAALLADGVRRVAQKVGEEGVETALAGVAEPDEALVGESADLVYHLVVLLHARGLDLADVAERLHQRHTRS